MRSRTKFFFSENSLVSVGFAFVIGAGILGAVVAHTNLANAVSIHTTEIGEVKERDKEIVGCLKEIRNELRTISTDIVKLQQITKEK